MEMSELVPKDLSEERRIEMKLVPEKGPPELILTLSLEPPGLPEYHSPNLWTCILSSTPGLGQLACLPGILTVTQGAPHISNGS